MQRPELETLFKIIRGSGEYPNLSFVCAFNKDALVQILSDRPNSQFVDLTLVTGIQSAQLGSISGDLVANNSRNVYEYLEKFFPVQIALPPMDDGSLATHFKARLRQFSEALQLLRTTEEREEFERAFEPLWTSHFKHSLTNIRKLNTYFNSLHSGFAPVRDDVNLLDFMLLELLHQTEPAIYDEVHKNRRFFYYPAWDIEYWPERYTNIGSEEAEKHGAAYRYLLRATRDQHRETVSALLGQLFPKFEEYWNGSKSGKPDERSADANRRIYHPAHFHTYFSHQVPIGFISERKIAAIFGQLRNKPDARSKVDLIVEEISGQTDVSRSRLLDRLSLSHQRVDKEDAYAIGIGTATIAHLFEEDDLGMGDRGAAERLIFIVAARFQDTDTIQTFLKEAARVNDFETRDSRVY